MSDNSKDIHRQEQKKVEPKVFPRSQGKKLHEAGGGMGNRGGEGSSQINARSVSTIQCCLKKDLVRIWRETSAQEEGRMIQPPVWPQDQRTLATCLL